MYRLLKIVFFVSLSREIFSAKILAIFPTPSFSHQVVFQPLMQELVRRGHEVTVLTADPAFKKENRPQNLTEIDVHDLSYSEWRKHFVYNVEFGRKWSLFGQIKSGFHVIGKVIEAQLNTSDIQRLIKDPDVKFDLLFLEAWTRQCLIYSHIFKAPVIQISSFGMFFNEETVGVPSHPFLYPMMMQQRLYNLTFWEKLYEIYKLWWLGNFRSSMETMEIETFRQILGKDLPDYRELRNNVDMLFINHHKMWIDNQPLPPNVIPIWGIHKKPIKPLPKDLNEYLDSAKNGVIYLSFGTNAPSSTLPSEFIQLLIRVFSKLPYDILWKWEKDELPGKSKNIKISKWLPQSDLLRHPNIKLFITQGGLQSTDEAITAGVPVIGIPMLGDQWYNVEKYERHNIGIRLDMETITEEKLEAAIKNVINDPKYRENIRRLRIIMNDQPQGALENAVWWTEYVLRHGGAKHLRSAAANMSWTQYYEIELVLTIIAVIFLIVIVCVTFIYMVLKSLPLKMKLKVS